MATHSTSKMLGQMLDKSKPKTTKNSESEIKETSEGFDAPQLRPTSELKPTSKAKPDPELGQVLSNILGPNASNQYSPMDKK